MLDLLLKVCPKEKLRFVFFDTGIEYKATKEHLVYLEQKYGIEIEREMANVPVPLGCKKYGIPFLSKDISAKINTLQNNNFDFVNDGNKNYDELIEKYPHCKRGIAWWTNHNQNCFNINKNAFLKEFMMINPPDFKISSQCCWGAKKSTSHKYEKNKKIDMKCVGMRKAEGGIRATKIKNCFEFDSKKETQDFRPIWWFSDKDKEVYCELYDVSHSKCYTEYGMKRTGCCGCPFNSRFEQDLEVVKEKEPMLYIACNNIFGKSYEYTRKYREFKEKMKKQTKNSINGQMSIEEIFEEV